MFAITKRIWKLSDGSKPDTAYFNLLPGRHELERVPNPKIKDGAPWLVLKGTLIGMTEGAWKDWKNGELIKAPGNSQDGKLTDYGDAEIVIEE